MTGALWKAVMVGYEGIGLIQGYDSHLVDAKERAGRTSIEGLKEDQLIARAKEGDSWATDRLIRCYYPKVYGIVFRMCAGNAEEKEDILQDALFRVVRSLKTFKGESTFYTWLYRIVINVCLDARRKTKRRRTFFPWRGPTDRDGTFSEEGLNHQDETRESDPQMSLSDRQFQKDLQRALENLSDKQRVVFELKVFEEWTIPEIAKMVKASEGTVKSHLFRATRSLREALGDWIP